MKPLTNWQAIGIGALVGIIAPFVYVITYVNYSSVSFSFLIISLEMIFSIGGALVGKSWRKTWLATVIGSIIGSLFPSVCVTIGFLGLSMLGELPPPNPWFTEHITLKSFDLPSGVSMEVISNDNSEYLVIKNYSAINLYVVAEPYEVRPNKENIFVELPSGLSPQYKIVNGQAYYWRNGWRNGRSTTSEGVIDSIWLGIYDNSIRCDSDRVLDLDPRNNFYGDRPKDVTIPESQDVLLPIVYSKEFIYVPLTISYALNSDYRLPKPSSTSILMQLASTLFLALVIIVFSIIVNWHLGKTS